MILRFLLGLILLPFAIMGVLVTLLIVAQLLGG